MFAFWHLRNLNPESSWHALVPDYETSTDEFYQGLRDAVAARRIPDLEISEIHFREGGLLSATRRYLRIRRERLVFDVCSAPFGTSWFFSCRYGETGLYGLDAVLLKLPVIGKFYERFLRGDTYFRDDSRQMYREAVDSLVRKAVEDAAGTKVQGGIRFRGQYAISRLGIVGRIREALKISWPPTNSG